MIIFLVQNPTQTPWAPIAAPRPSLRSLRMSSSTLHASQPSGPVACGPEWSHLPSRLLRSYRAGLVTERILGKPASAHGWAVPPSGLSSPTSGLLGSYSRVGWDHRKPRAACPDGWETWGVFGNIVSGFRGCQGAALGA